MPRRRVACRLAALFASVPFASVLFVSVLPALAGEEFPFGSALMLDTPPIRGSKRVPVLQIEEDGTASIDLWCARLRGQATVGDGSIAIVPALTPQARCDPESEARDVALLGTLSQVTGWKRRGEVLELSGPTVLRFHLMTN